MLFVEFDTTGAGAKFREQVDGFIILGSQDALPPSRLGTKLPVSKDVTREIYYEAKVSQGMAKRWEHGNVFKTAVSRERAPSRSHGRTKDFQVSDSKRSASVQDMSTIDRNIVAEMTIWN